MDEAQDRDDRHQRRPPRAPPQGAGEGRRDDEGAEQQQEGEVRRVEERYRLPLGDGMRRRDLARDVDEQREPVRVQGDGPAGGEQDRPAPRVALPRRQERHQAEHPDADGEARMGVSPQRENGGDAGDFDPRSGALAVAPVQPRQQRGETQVGEELRAGGEAPRQDGQGQDHDRTAHPERAAAPGHRQPHQPGGEQADRRLEEPQAGAAAELEDLGQDDLGKPLVVDPGGAGGGVRQIVEAGEMAGQEDSLARQQVDPQVVVGFVVAEEVDRAGDDQQDPGGARPGGLRRARSGHRRRLSPPCRATRAARFAAGFPSGLVTGSRDRGTADGAAAGPSRR